MNRRWLDVAFAVAIAATIATALHLRAEGVPALPAHLVATAISGDRPALPPRVAIAAVFADIHGPRDVTGWSIDALARDLEQRGFVRESSSRLSRADATVDLVRSPDDAAVVERALNAVLATHDVVYYNGHNFGGSLVLSPRAPLVVLDTCWSAQYYGALAERTTLVANTERAITGSVSSFVALLDGLLARDRTWTSLLAAMNAPAVARAVDRTQYPDPERYVLVRAVMTQARSPQRDRHDRRGVSSALARRPAAGVARAARAR